MENKNLYILLVLATACVILYLFINFSSDPFSQEDKKLGEEAIRTLEEMIEKGVNIPEVTDEKLKELQDNILIVKTLTDNVEGLKYAPTLNTNYWPQYYYSSPYSYTYGGAWPPDLYSRLNYWSPGFYTGTGWSYYMRPGMGYKSWPRNRWVRSTASEDTKYYYINNDGHDLSYY